MNKQFKRAIDNGDVPRVRELLSRDPSLASSPITWGGFLNKCKAEPLHYLSDAPFNQVFDHGKQAELAHILLDAGAPPDGLPTSGETPLHGAASLGEAGVAAALIDRGANLESIAKYPGIPHGTPLDFAVHFGMVDVVDLLVDRGAKVLSARIAAGAGQLDRISGDSAEFEINDDDKLDVFRCAVVCDRIQIVEHLLSQGNVDVNADLEGATALHWAAWEAKPRMVEFLLTRGADRTTRDRQHEATAEQWATHRGKQLGPRWGHGEVVKALNVTLILVAVCVCCGLAAARALAEPRHTPTKMPAAKAESVGMSTEGLNRIDEVMQAHIDAGRIQGAVTIVARRGQVVHFSTHGKMDVERGRAMEPDAIFRMASSTKPVLGVAVMKLIEEGLISPSDPVSKYIPEFANLTVAVLAEPSDREVSPTWVDPRGGVPEYRLVPARTPMTIHHLLTHTSGLVSGGLGSAANPVRRTPEDTLESYVAKLATVPLDFQPGTRWAYGNAAIHAVLPRIIEIVSGTPCEEFVRERVLNPLEMNNSYFNLPSDKEAKRVVVIFKRREVKKKSGGMGLSSTAEDYLHFQQMLLNGGELFGDQLLRPESVEMMSSNQVDDLFSRGKKGQKGMGFGYTVAVTLDPEVVANHRGKGSFGWGGAGGTMSWTDPENELVAVLMLQQPHGSMQRDFAKAILEAIIE